MDKEPDEVKTFTRDEIKGMIEEVRTLAGNHTSDYTAGMRHACVKIEERLYDDD